VSSELAKYHQHGELTTFVTAFHPGQVGYEDLRTSSIVLEVESVSKQLLLF